MFLEIKAKIHEALCDSIDTRLVIEKMRELINASNVYIKDKVMRSQFEVPSPPLL